MSWTPDEARQIGRIETKLDALNDIEDRVGALERFRAYTKGVTATITLAVSAISYYFTRG